MIEPDIVMLNSNTLKKFSNYIYPLNNQYYILNELNKNIHSHLRLKSFVLNEENLKKALNLKGERLIIQSDDFTLKGELVLESEKGEREILNMKKIHKIFKNTIQNYKLVILCFLNSFKFKEYLDLNYIDYQNLLSFNYYEPPHTKSDVLEEYNKTIIEFIISFIKNIVDNKKDDDIKTILKSTK